MEKEDRQDLIVSVNVLKKEKDRETEKWI